MMVVANPLIPVPNIQPVLTHYSGADTRRFHDLPTGRLACHSAKNLNRVMVIPNYPSDSPYGPDGQILLRIEAGQLINTCA